MPKEHSYKFCFGPWNISEGSDPYGPTTRAAQTFDWKLAQLKKHGFEAMMFHDDDAVPEIDGKSDQQLRKEAKELKKRLDDAGIVAEMVPHLRPANWTTQRLLAVKDHPVRVTGQLFLDSRNTVARRLPKKKLHPEFPLRRFLRCPECGEPVRGYAAVKRDGRRFPYYHPGFFNGIFTFAQVGGLIAPATLGYLAELVDVRIVLGIPLIGTFMVMALMVLIWLESRVTGR